MNADNISLIPVWKAGDTLTAADRLHELALYAQVHPEKFARFVLVRQGDDLPSGNHTYDHFQFGCDLAQQIGMFAIGQSLALDHSKP